jgi:aminoacyl tRNA synthase complex-interacting multifunctional protein 1
MNFLAAPIAALDEIIGCVEASLIVTDEKHAPPAQVGKPAPSLTPTRVISGDASAALDTATVPADDGSSLKPQKKKKEKKAKAPAAPLLPEATSQWHMCDLRVGRVLTVGTHPEADGLYVLSIGVGGGETRSVCAGLRAYVPEEEMAGRLVVLICNLKPRKLRGVDSTAMCLAGSVRSAEDGEKETVVPIAPPAACAEGEIIRIAGMGGERAVEDGKFVSTKNWERVGARFAVKDGKACYDGTPMVAGPEDASHVLCALPDGAEIH